MKTALRALCYLAGFMFVIASMHAQVNYNQSCTSVQGDPPQTFTWNVQFTLDRSIMLPSQTANGTFSDTCPDVFGQTVVQAGCLPNQTDWPTYQNVDISGICSDSWNITDVSGTHKGSYLDPVQAPTCQTGVVYGSPGNYNASFQYTAPPPLNDELTPYQIFFWGPFYSCSGAPPSITVVQDNSADLGAASPRSGCEGTCGSPLNLTNGNIWIKEDEYSLPGLGGGLHLSRTWNSLWPFNFPFQQVGMFGDSWQSNYEEHLQITASGATYWRADGSAFEFSYNSKAKTYTMVSPPDERATLIYTSKGQIYTVTLLNGSQRIFNLSGYLTTLVDPNGNKATVTLDSSNRVTSVSDAANRTLNFNYATPNFPKLVSSVQDSVGTIATYSYDAGEHLIKVIYADASVVNYNYDANGLILSTTDAQGKTLESHTYDNVRRGLTSARANGVDQVSVTYSTASPQVATLLDSNNNSTTYGVHQVGNRNYISSTSGSGCDSCGGRGNYSYTYDSQGNRLTSTDPLGHLTKFSYDSNGDVTQKQIQSDSSGTQFQNWSYTYNSLGEVLTATDPLGNMTTNTYDTKGNLLTTTTPPPSSGGSGSKSSFTYDSKGELLTITDPNLNKTTLAYNAVGLISSVTDAQSKVTQFQYDARGNRTAIIDALNQQTTFTYDSMNRLTTITYPTSPATYTRFGYDYRGRKISVTDPNGKLTQYGYDDADRLISSTDPNNGLTQYAYDSENNLSSILDQANNKTSFQYDAYGDLIQTTFPSNLTEGYSYDLNRNLLTKTDRNSHTINYSYDYLNRLSTKSYPDSTSVTYIYDLANRLIQVSDATGTYGMSYDNTGRLTQTSTAYSFLAGSPLTVKYGYDAASNRTSMTDPQNTSTSYAYDSLNRLGTLTYPASTNYGFTYDALSRRTKLTRPNGITSNYGYDPLSRLISVLHQVGSTVLDGATYAYDAAGNRTSKTDNRTDITSTYGYDPLYELTQVLQGSTTTESYNYDSVGNRLSSLGVSPYVYNSSNQLSSYPGLTYTYDNNGNTLTKVAPAGTTSYSWDFENRLTSVTPPGSGGTVNFRYDPFGRRIQKASSTGTTNYVYEGANVLEEVDGSGNVVARYVQNSGLDEPLAETRGSTTSYYEADGLGSITSLSNSSGALASTYTYDSFGNVTASSGTVTNPIQYTGREFDLESGLYYYRARSYDPAKGRFLSEDPARFSSGSANFYTYVRNNPVNSIDPFGLAQCTYSISMHQMLCQPNADGFQPSIIGPNGPGAVTLGPNGVFSGLQSKGCMNEPKCEYNRNEGPIPPGRYKMNYYPIDEHERFRLEPWPSDFPSRLSRDLGHWRFHGLGAQLHLGHYSMGCINANQDDPSVVQQYRQMLQLLMQENGNNFLTVIE